MSNPISIFGKPLGPIAPGFKSGEGFSLPKDEAPSTTPAQSQSALLTAQSAAGSGAVIPPAQNVPSPISLADRYDKVMQENPEKFSAPYRALFAAGDL